ncbi:MAG: stage III sporulation AC/AD family protein [Oscillospiraceae bacterium]|nr:stage III sporulation AC/AD family protein [Oscillospiraceae bacterium]
MSVLIKAAAIGIAGVVLSLLLKKTAPEMSFAVGLAVSLMGVVLAMELFQGLSDMIVQTVEQIELSAAVVNPVLKCAGIGIITRISADLCRDGGQAAVASAVELCGAACAVMTALPLIQALFQMINNMV